ncbi:quinolinate synthase [candidate division KSB1 bacterium]|nr:MAG: quinolinate synthase [candidate division KSB1 bacterium]
MKNQELIHKINKLKSEKDAVILAHNYQIPEIQQTADFLGDSLDLARKAHSDSHSVIVFCGVKFMAETAKILSPDKKVLLPATDANCPMAEMAEKRALLKLKEQYPDAQVVTYVNSTAEVKAISDVCCTSANSVKIVNNLDTDTIIFVPDKNLGAYTQKFTDKKLILWDGFCYVHNQFSSEEIDGAKQNYPDAVIMVHPECTPEVIKKADKVFSTSGMVKFAKESDKKTFIVGTEQGLIHRLKRENPDKQFLSLGAAKTCRGMKAIKLIDVYNALKNDQHQIHLRDDVMTGARKAIEKMLDYA